MLFTALETNLTSNSFVQTLYQVGLLQLLFDALMAAIGCAQGALTDYVNCLHCKSSRCALEASSTSPDVTCFATVAASVRTRSWT